MVPLDIIDGTTAHVTAFTNLVLAVKWLWAVHCSCYCITNLVLGVKWLWAVPLFIARFHLYYSKAQIPVVEEWVRIPVCHAYPYMNQDAIVFNAL